MDRVIGLMIWLLMPLSLMTTGIDAETSTPVTSFEETTVTIIQLTVSGESSLPPSSETNSNIIPSLITSEASKTVTQDIRELISTSGKSLSSSSSEAASEIISSTTPEAITTTIPATNGHGEPCNGSCGDNETECWNNMCVCTVDYYWSKGSTTCLKIEFEVEIMITQVTNTSLFLNWTEPEIDESVDRTIKYNVTREADGEVWNTIVNTTNTNVSGLIPGQSYEFRVLMIFSDEGRDKTVPSNVKNVTTVPDPPYSMNVSSTFVPNITLKFGTRGNISYCTVTIVDGNDFNITEITENKCESLEVDGLENGTSYTVTVTATSGDEISEQSIFSFNTSDFESDPVVNLTVMNVTATSTLLTWNPPEHPYGHIAGYKIVVLATNITVCFFGWLPSEPDQISCDKSEQQSVSSCTRYKVQLHKQKNTVKCNMTEVEETDESVKFAFDGLLPDTNYTLRVAAVNGAGEGIWSEAVMRTLIAVPIPITNFNVAEVNCTFMTLRWDPPSPYPGPTFYELNITDMGPEYYSEHSNTESDDNVNYRVNLTGYNNITHTFYNLTPAWNYTFTLKAVTAAGPSNKVSTESNTLDCEPDKVKNLNITQDQDNFTAAEVVWECPDIRQRNTKITGFYIELVQLDDNTTVDSAIIEGDCSISEEQHTQISVKPDIKYQIKVMILGLKNSTSWAIINYTAPSGPSQEVQHLNASSVSPRSINVTWTQPQVTNGNITAYVILLKSSDGNCLQRFVLSNAADNSFNFSNDSTKCEGNVGQYSSFISEEATIYINQLEPDTTYTVTVTPYNSYGPGIPHNITVTLPAEIPNPVPNFNVEDVNCTSLTLRWDAPQPFPGRTFYELNITDIGSVYYNEYVNDESYNNMTSIVNVTGYNNTTYTFYHLTPAWNYSFSLKAVTAVGSSEEVLNQSRTDDCEPDKVKNLNITQDQDNFTAAEVVWECPDIRQRNTKITGFYIELVQLDDNTTVDSAIIEGDCSISEEQQTQISVKPDLKYQIKVMILGLKNSTLWETINYEAPSGPSQEVQHLNASSVSPRSINVTWTQPQVTNGNITAYVILLNSSDGKCLQRFVLSNAADNSFNFSNDSTKCEGNVGQYSSFISEEATIYINQLEPDTTYTVTVIPYNSYGPGMPHNITVTLPAEIPNPVSNFNVEDVNCTSVTLSWDAPYPRPGTTFYELNITDIGSVYYNEYVNDEPYNNMNFNLTGYNNTTYTFYNLTPAWNYSFTLKAFTTAGSSKEVLNQSRTDDCEPSIVKHLNYTQIPDNFTAVQVQWECPDIRERNTQITGFYIGLKKSNDDNKTTYSVNVESNCSDSRAQQTIPVLPENDYQIEVKILGLKNSSSSANISFTASSGPSEKVQGLNASHINFTAITVSWICPHLPNGYITAYAILLHNTYTGECLQNFTLSDAHANVFFYSNASARCEKPVEIKSATNFQDPCQQTIYINQLEPETTYNVTVIPYNSYGSGTPVSTNVTLPAGIPSVLNVTFEFAKDPSNRTIEFKWDPPKPRPGATNYSVTVSRSGNPYEKSNYKAEDEHLVNISGWDTNKAVASYSYHGWEYRFQLDVFTRAGGPPPFVLNITTPEDAPGKVQNLNVTSINNDFYSVNVTWDCPRLGERNGRIQNFTLNYRKLTDSSLGETNSTSLTVPLKDSNCELKSFSQNVSVSPGNIYNFQVFANNANFTGIPVFVNYSTPVIPEDAVDAGAIVGAVLGAVCAVAAVVGLVWYRHRPARKQHSFKYDQVDMDTLNFNVRPVPMHDFKDKVQEWLSLEQNERGLPVILAEQFKEIKELSEKKHSRDAALTDENKGKNRYTNILPYDHSRVKLSIKDNEESSDFINANFIPGYHSKHEYIATQGPLESTVNDFWQMVWEQQVPAILMLSGFMEGHTNKVYPYYPTDNTLFKSISYGAITVMLKEVVETAGYTRKTFEIERNRQSRTVYHFYIKGWKDYDANLPVNPVLAFVQAVRDLVPVNSKHPLLVHCSAGVGRTGTIIGIDYFMHYVREKSLSEPIDIFRYVLLMREYRPSMVQSCEQYVFLHKAVAELVRRKKDPDHYDEPVYTNMAYEEDEHMYANC